jgi:hypothetical protein
MSPRRIDEVFTWSGNRGLNWQDFVRQVSPSEIAQAFVYARVGPPGTCGSAGQPAGSAAGA